MSIEAPDKHYYLGKTVADQQPLFLDSSNLTTHGVIVGMTGSGKTGLGIVLLEEALQQGTPTLIIDPKGDMGNLLLSFPDLLPTDFMPWISDSDAGDDKVQAAVDTATRWKEGLQRSGLAPDRIKALHDSADFSIYTPGSQSGIPLNIIGSLKAPPAGTDAETLQDEIEGLASSLLTLVGIESDPLSGREHILLANLIHWKWTKHEDMDLASLIGLIQKPPMRKLGVIDVDTFFPVSDRVKLALKINGLAASPSFSSWSEGRDLDIQDLLYSASGKAQAAIVTLSHLSETERQFVVTLLLSKMVTWMRAQPGTTDLRALIYIDEVFGYVPPVGMPPSKKPILTILKQARAFGVGLVLSTQNPVDIDYKAISNAGTWMIGRLQTERDKQRLLDGMGASDGSVDISAISDTISALEKREFVMHSTRTSVPQHFATRWAMSFLPGPLTREQISLLISDEQRRTGEPSEEPNADHGDGKDILRADESQLTPQVADGVAVRYLDPAASYLDALQGSGSGTRLQAAVAIRVKLLFDETRANLRHEAEWEAVITPLEGPVEADSAVLVDYDERDLLREAPDDAVYRLPDAKIANKSYFRSAQSAIKNHLHREQQIELFRNASLKLYSRIDETFDQFQERCIREADNKADEDADKIRRVLAKKIDRINAAIQKSDDRIREIQFDAISRRKDQRTSQVMDIAGGLLGSLLGGRRSTRSIITGGLRRSQSKGRMVAKAEERLKTAENRYNELLEDREELENTLSEDLFEIQEEWSKKAEDINALTVGLEKTDISIDDISLVWIPVDA
ncbi:MAG: ATP-binding protein [Granulosicoccus sp.]